MKTALFLICAVVQMTLTKPALADTRGSFSGNKAVIVVQGQPDDTDALRLFESLNVLPTEDASTVKKELSFNTVSGEKALDVLCTISKSVQNFGSCTLKIYKTQWASIGTSSVLLAFNRDQNSELISALFNPPTNEQIYQSQDGKLSIRLDSDATSKKLFSLVYR